MADPTPNTADQYEAWDPAALQIALSRGQPAAPPQQLTPPPAPPPGMQSSPAGGMMPTPEVNLGSTDTQPATSRQQPQTGPPRPSNVPALAGLFHQLFGDQAARGYFPATGSPGAAGSEPARPVSRLDAFENFLGNFLSSFGQGMANAGTGPAANARGFGAALQAPYQRELQQYQLGQQQQMQQAQRGLIGAQTGAQQASATEAQARTGLIGAQTTGADIENQMRERQLAMMTQMGQDLAQGRSPFDALGPLSRNELAIKNAAISQYYRTGDAKEIFDGIKQITNNRAVSSRTSGSSNILPSANSVTGFKKQILDRDGNPVREVENIVVPGMTPKLTSRQVIQKDQDGNDVVVTLSGENRPIIPGAPGVAGGGATPGAAGGGGPAPLPPNNAHPITMNGRPLHQPMGAAPKQTLFQIDSALNLADRIRPDLESVAKDIGRGGNLSDSAKVRSAWTQYQSLGIDPANVDPNSVVSMMPGVDPRLAHLMPTIALLQIIGASPYLRGTRNYNFVTQIQQHLPDPTKDTPQLMVSKLQQLVRNLPGLEAALYKSEGIDPRPDTAMLTRYANLAGGNAAKMKLMMRQDGWNIDATPSR